MCRVQWSVVSALVVVVIVASFIQSGDALRCWMCSTIFNINCEDNFNGTKMKQNFSEINYRHYPKEKRITLAPHLEECEANSPLSNHLDINKFVCIKVTIKNPISPDFPIVTRGCEVVPSTFKEGECPGIEGATEYCGSCSKDECNSAKGLQINIMLACSLPLILFFLMKQ